MNRFGDMSMYAKVMGIVYAHTRARPRRFETVVACRRHASTRVLGRARPRSMAEAWVSPLDVDVHSRTTVDEDLERAVASSGAYARAARAQAFTRDDFASPEARIAALSVDGSTTTTSSPSSFVPKVVIVGVGSEAGADACEAAARAVSARTRGVVIASDAREMTRRAPHSGTGEKTHASFLTPSVSSPQSSCTMYEDIERGVIFVETRCELVAAGARAWAKEVLRACGCVAGAPTRVLILTGCSELETSEAEMSHELIDSVQAYALETSAVKANAAAWPPAPRPLPIGVFLPSNGAAALLTMCEMLNIEARAVAIPESEPVRVMFAGADVNAARQAAAHAAEVLGFEFTCEFKTRRAPIRADNVYA